MCDEEILDLYFARDERALISTMAPIASSWQTAFCPSGRMRRKP